uniref:Uncharacterized protein n=1 Tax=Arundo donax TaxID=35708 RepID=A0A0A9CAD2_ARUDO
MSVRSAGAAAGEERRR